jgi:hypothetical protein
LLCPISNPIFFEFRVYAPDSKSMEDNLLYERKISIQSKEALQEGLQLHLFQLERKKDCYRLSAIATDNNEVKFKSIASIALSNIGTVNGTNQRHLNTLIMQIID